MAALTEEQKQVRRQRTEERKARERERWEQERRDKQATAEAMRAVLKHPDSNPDQLIFAVEVLENLGYYHFIPTNSFSRIQQDVKADEQRRAFREEFSRKHQDTTL